jgi:hypothetical protein
MGDTVWIFWTDSPVLPAGLLVVAFFPAITPVVLRWIPAR